MLKYYNWKKFSIIAEETEKYVAEALKEQALSINMTINHFKLIKNPHDCCERNLDCCNNMFWYQTVHETMVNTRSMNI